MQAAKKDKREEHVAVCVVQRRDDASCANDRHSFLLTKRPDQGLLAGLWEFPSVAVDAEASEATRQVALDTLLHETLNLQKALSHWRVVHRQAVGSTVHVFSHIRMTLHVEHMLVEGSSNVCAAEGEKLGTSSTMWVEYAALVDGTHKLTGAPSKAFDLVVNKASKTKKNTSATKENTITSFFKPVSS